MMKQVTNVRMLTHGGSVARKSGCAFFSNLIQRLLYLIV